MWQASLELELAQRAQKTVLTRARHRGPLRVQRPFYPENPDEACHVYMVHPPGGAVGGDTLDIAVDAQPGTRALLTTPGAAKFYRSDARWAHQRVSCRIGRGAVLEWLPQETILFSGSYARQELRVELAPEACFIGWEITCLGRPAAGERFARGTYAQTMEIRREGRLLWLERGNYEGGSERLDAAWGLAGYPVSGLLVCVPPAAQEADFIHMIRAAAAGFPDCDLHGVTWFGEVLVCRYLGTSAWAVRSALITLWTALRPYIIGRAAVLPRIWAT